MSDVRDVRAALEQVLEATGEPPAAETDPEETIARASTMAGAREHALEGLRALIDAGAARPEGIDGVLATIAERDARWRAALARARVVLGERLAAARHAARSSSSQR